MLVIWKAQCKMYGDPMYYFCLFFCKPKVTLKIKFIVYI